MWEVSLVWFGRRISSLSSLPLPKVLTFLHAMCSRKTVPTTDRRIFVADEDIAFTGRVDRIYGCRAQPNLAQHQMLHRVRDTSRIHCFVSTPSTSPRPWAINCALDSYSNNGNCLRLIHVFQPHRWRWVKGMYPRLNYCCPPMCSNGCEHQCTLGRFGAIG